MRLLSAWMSANSCNVTADTWPVLDVTWEWMQGSKSVTKRGGSQPKVGGSQARSKKGGKEEGGTGLLGGLFNKK